MTVAKSLYKKPQIAFRVDSSVEIGHGHVMRCLTLASALQPHYHIVFICADLHGHAGERILAQGFELVLLDRSDSPSCEYSALAHAAWLHTSPLHDAQQTVTALQQQHITGLAWLVVDHYALDQTWQTHLRQATQLRYILVIDDLADRCHDCDLLLDQNMGRKPQDYSPYIKPNTRLLLGLGYALLRADFYRWRSFSLQRRDSLTQPKNLLVSLGGVDAANVTTKVLQQLAMQPKIIDWHIQVIMGKTAPHIAEVNAQVKRLQEQGVATQCLINPSSMAECMSYADYAICAAGSTTWERFCLGVPALTLIVADNQCRVGRRLKAIGDVLTPNELTTHFERIWQGVTLSRLQQESQEIRQGVDGTGVTKVVNAMRAFQREGEVLSHQ